MEMNKQQRIQTPSQLISSCNFLKPVTKVLLPFSVLSVILSYPLLCNFHILAQGLQLSTFSIGKNYMFLLFNGLLVFIATSSGLIGRFSVETDFKAEKTMKSKGGSPRELQVGSSEQKGSIAKAKVIPEMDSLALVQGRDDVPLVVQDEGGEQRHELVSVEEDEDEDEEEFNKKCEDFIRKMKKGIKFEASN